MRTQGHVCEFPEEKNKITTATGAVSSMNNVKHRQMVKLNQHSESV
jgi:hypothetical protein